MKQKDFALIGLVIVISVVVSYLISNLIFSTPKNRQQKVDVVQSISSSFDQPDKKYFNSNSFDPTVIISINQNNNPTPFNVTKN